MPKAKGFKDLQTDHLKCRSLLHAWDPIETNLIRVGNRRAFEVELECLRCGGGRTDQIAMSGGELIKRVYHYPDNYIVEELKSWGGRGELLRNARVELYSRLEKGR